MDNIRLSELPQASKTFFDHRFLAIEPSGTNSYKNVIVQYGTISTDILNDAVLSANSHSDTQLTQKYNTLVSKIDTDVGQVTTSINDMKARAGNMITLTATCMSARTEAALSIDSLSTKIFRPESGALDLLSSVLSSAAKGYTDSNIQTLNTTIGDLETSLNTGIQQLNLDLDGLTATVNSVSTNVSSVGELNNAFQTVNNNITSLNDIVVSLKDSVATDTKLGLIKIGYADDPDNHYYGVRLQEGKAYVCVPGGGGGGGGSLPIEWYDVKDYVLYNLSNAFGTNCTKYNNTIATINNTLDEISSRFIYANDTFSVEDEYHVVVLDSAYAKTQDNKYYIATDEPIDPNKEHIPEYDPELTYRYLVEVIADKIYYAKSIDLAEQKFIDEDDISHDIDTLEKYDLILVDNKVYVVKESTVGTRILAEEANTSNACYVAKAKDEEDEEDDENAADIIKYVSYININYNIGKFLLDFIAVKEDITTLVNDAINESENDIIKYIIQSYSVVYESSNSESIELQANSTKTVVIELTSVSKYTPIAIQTVEIDNANVHITAASTFNNKAYVTLFNNSNDAITLAVGDINIEVRYILTSM